MSQAMKVEWSWPLCAGVPGSTRREGWEVGLAKKKKKKGAW